MGLFFVVADARAQQHTHTTFKKIQLTDEYYSEGANFGDFNGDGAQDVVSGPFIYMGPDFDKKHEIYPPVPQDRNRYSFDNFFSFVHDINEDGRSDILTFGLPGTPAFLYINPGSAAFDQHWPRHQVFDWVSNESPHFTDITGDGQPEIICTRDGKFGYVTYDPQNPTKPWVFHAISDSVASKKFGHGLGVGDVNGDGYLDIIQQKGWYRRPANIVEGKNWEFKEFVFAPRGGAQMYAYDVDGDGDNDIITSMEAHGYGLAWFEQIQRGGRLEFLKHDIMTDNEAGNDYGVCFSELHAVELADVDGDGLKDIITGKCYWSHHKKTPSWNDGAVVYWFKLVRNNGRVDWVPHQADDDSGVGRQIVAADVSGDGKPDFVTGGMKGAFALIQQTRHVSKAEYDKLRPKLTPAGRQRRANSARSAAPAKLDANGYLPRWPKGIAPIGADGQPLNLDFETGNLADWDASRDGFSLQPIKTANDGAGKFALRSSDAATGTITSKPFKINHISASFMIAGGKTKASRVEFVYADTDKPFYVVSGAGDDKLRPVYVDARSSMGREVYIRIVDDSNEPGARIAFDEFRFHANRPAFPVPLHNVPPAPLDQYANAGLAPEEAAEAMSVPEGFSVSLFAGEPDVVQPIAMAIDHRGRLWVAEAYSYPVKVKPEDARDRILIFEDTDNDGTFDKRKVFIDKLNLVSGLEVGHGGVWIGQPPHLLFVPDQDGDDVPDSEPQVLLDGWGMQDTHETLNAFIWGPDGWLYGCHGVFTRSLVGKPGTPDDQRTPLNAGIWRYHPSRHEFEVFAHGGSNQWGVDFNDYGQAFMTACVIPHLYHVVQNARYLRQAGSHFNPYTYDDIKTIADHQHWVGNRPHAGNNRSDEVGGGHAHAGAMIYLGGKWPAKYRNQLFMNNIHGARINVDALTRVGSGFSGAHSADFVEANDSWSQILNLRYGPDGNVYMIDWYDQEQCHRRDPTTHDRTNGRIFKVAYGATQPVNVDLTKNSDSELVAMLARENDWYVRHARRVLHERTDAGTLEADTHQKLVALARSSEDPKVKLRILWALHVTGGLTDGIADVLLRHENEYLRAWTIQLVCEDGQATSQQLATFATMARDDPSPVVRLYLASVLGQLPNADRWAIAENLVTRGDDAKDVNIPFVLWYGVEPLVADNPERALSMARASQIPTVANYITRRAASSDAS
ncbi:MAG: PVC-type heme-binding CxxCH protein, partial [Planctomycetota bacterium]